MLYLKTLHQKVKILEWKFKKKLCSPVYYFFNAKHFHAQPACHLLQNYATVSYAHNNSLKRYFQPHKIFNSLTKEKLNNLIIWFNSRLKDARNDTTTPLHYI